MMNKDPKDYVDMSFEAIQANIDHHSAEMVELEQKFEQRECEKMFWESVKELKSVL